MCGAYASCVLPDCYDPKKVSPFPRERMPQFVLLSHDDEINSVTLEAFQAARLCDAKVTFMTMWAEIDCRYVQGFYNADHEIALHTIHHYHLPEVPLDGLRNEMLGVRDLINKKCDIPLEEMVGFRAPYLETDVDTRRVLYEDGIIQWEASYYTDTYPLSPFTEDSGLVINSTGIESWPGMWQIPLNLIDDDENGATYTMDPGRMSESDDDPNDPGSFVPAEQMLNALIKTFDAQYYNGTKLPFSVNFHTPWLLAEGYSAALGEFLDYVRQFDDVYFITFSQLVAWMKDPIPLEFMAPVDRGCELIVIPPLTFLQKYGTFIILLSAILGPLILLSFAVAIAQVLWFMKK
jgi:hypothetical protein